MVKADAYGLGAVRVARALEALDPWGYGVATVAEGDELRRGGITRPIVVFTPILRTEIDAAPPRRPHAGARRSGGRSSRGRGRAGPGICRSTPGWSRAGMPWDDVARASRRCSRAPRPKACSRTSTPPSCDDGSRDAAGAALRRGARRAAGASRRSCTPRTARRSSAARRRAGRSCVRGSFSMACAAATAADSCPNRSSSMRARIVELRTVADGETVSYDAHLARRRDRDGSPRSPWGTPTATDARSSNRASALLRGTRVPVAGRVTMDMTMFDVTGHRCALGDVVTLIGARRRRASSTVTELAGTGELSPYEVLTGLRRACRAAIVTDAPRRPHEAPRRDPRARRRRHRRSAGRRRLRRRRERHARQPARARRRTGAAAISPRPGSATSRRSRAWRPTDAPDGRVGIMQPASAGKDSTTGHWEIAGLHLARPFPTYPERLSRRASSRRSRGDGTRR